MTIPGEALAPRKRRGARGALVFATLASLTCAGACRGIVGIEDLGLLQSTDAGADAVADATLGPPHLGDGAPDPSADGSADSGQLDSGAAADTSLETGSSDAEAESDGEAADARDANADAGTDARAPGDAGPDAAGQGDASRADAAPPPVCRQPDRAACQGCCHDTYPTENQALDQGLRPCACGPSGACQSACAATYCSMMGGAPPDMTCVNCLSDLVKGATCTALTTCIADPRCSSLGECIRDCP